MPKRKHETLGVDDDEKSAISGECNIILDDYLSMHGTTYDKFVDGIICRSCEKTVGSHQRMVKIGMVTKFWDIFGDYMTMLIAQFGPSPIRAGGLYTSSGSESDVADLFNLQAFVSGSNKKSKLNDDK